MCFRGRGRQVAGGVEFIKGAVLQDLLCTILHYYGIIKPWALYSFMNVDNDFMEMRLGEKEEG